MHPDKVKALLNRVGVLKRALKQANTELRPLRESVQGLQRREATVRQMLDQKASLEDIRKFFG